MNNVNNTNSIISLEEEGNSFHQTSMPEKAKKKDNCGKDKSSLSSSFFGSIINSVSKIGQGLKKIMSMRINFENDEDENNPNLYNQILNRYNNNEEISLIEAPSFMDDSNFPIEKNFNFNPNNNNEINNDSNIMMVSQNDINNNNNNNSTIVVNNDNNKVSNDNENFNIINTDIIPKKERKINKIKSSFLNKKRASESKLENIFEGDEEEKNEEKNVSNNLNMSKDNNINTSERKNKLNNSSMMSLSMKSLDNIKNEISKRREENLRNVEEMHKRYGLYYDYLKEGEMREKILEEYFKEKAKRLAETKLQIEREKLKREEKFQKLKIKKINGFKYTSSIKKKPNILSETKSSEIQFKPSSSGINFSAQQKKEEEVKQPNTFPKAGPSVNLNFTFGPGSISPNITNNNNNGNEKKEKENEEEKEKNKEVKPSQGLFKFSFNNPEPEKEKKNLPILFERKDTTEENNSKKLFDNKTQSIFSSFLGNQKQEKKPEEKKEEIKNTKEEDFFSSSSNNNLFTGPSIFTRKQSQSNEPGLFNQNNQVSQSINQESLFSSNKIDNKITTSNSLVTKNNPFLQAGAGVSNPHPKNLFGTSVENTDNNTQQNQGQSIFGTFSFGNSNEGGKSLFS